MYEHLKHEDNNSSVYISGPMTGYANYNLDAFAKAENELNAKGYLGVNPGWRGVINEYEYEDYLRDALALLLKCKGLALLPGWVNSRGAQLEYRIASNLLMPTFSIEQWLK